MTDRVTAGEVGTYTGVPAAVGLDLNRTVGVRAVAAALSADEVVSAYSLRDAVDGVCNANDGNDFADVVSVEVLVDGPQQKAAGEDGNLAVETVGRVIRL